MVHELLTVLQRADFNYPSFFEDLKTRKHCSQVISRQSKEGVVHAGSAQELIYMEPVVENSRPVLYKKDMVKMSRKQVLLACREDVTFRPGHSKWGDDYQLKNSKWL